MGRNFTYVRGGLIITALCVTYYAASMCAPLVQCKTRRLIRGFKGEQGPMGPMGPKGDQGPPGVDDNLNKRIEHIEKDIADLKQTVYGTLVTYVYAERSVKGE